MLGILSWIIFVVAYWIVFSVLGSPLDAVWTASAPLVLFLECMAVFLLYGAIHAPEIAKFYGMYASRLRGEDPEALVQLGLHKKRPAGG